MDAVLPLTLQHRLESSDLGISEVHDGCWYPDCRYAGKLSVKEESVMHRIRRRERAKGEKNKIPHGVSDLAGLHWIFI